MLSVNQTLCNSHQNLTRSPCLAHRASQKASWQISQHQDQATPGYPICDSICEVTLSRILLPGSKTSGAFLNMYFSAAPILPFRRESFSQATHTFCLPIGRLLGSGSTLVLVHVALVDHIGTRGYLGSKTHHFHHIHPVSCEHSNTFSLWCRRAQNDLCIR